MINGMVHVRWRVVRMAVRGRGAYVARGVSRHVLEMKALLYTSTLDTRTTRTFRGGGVIERVCSYCAGVLTYFGRQESGYSIQQQFQFQFQFQVPSPNTNTSSAIGN